MSERNGLPAETAKALHALRRFGYRACVRLLVVDPQARPIIRRMTKIFVEGGMRDVALAGARREMIALSDALDELLRMSRTQLATVAISEGVQAAGRAIGQQQQPKMGQRHAMEISGSHAASSDASVSGGRNAVASKATPRACANDRSAG